MCVSCFIRKNIHLLSGTVHAGLSKELLQGIVAAGFKRPSKIQASALPYILSGKNVIGQAQHGALRCEHSFLLSLFFLLLSLLFPRVFLCR